MSAEQPQWNQFIRKIYINRPQQDIYNAWARPSLIEKWFLQNAAYTTGKKARDKHTQVEKGDRFEWHWHGWDHTEKGEILEANGENRLAFTFGPEGKVLIQLERDRDMTLHTLTQSDIPTDEKHKMELYVGCSNGWTFWMANLKAFLEHGITLHDTTVPPEKNKNLVNT